LIVSQSQCVVIVATFVYYRIMAHQDRNVSDIYFRGCFIYQPGVLSIYSRARVSDIPNFEFETARRTITQNSTTAPVARRLLVPPLRMITWYDAVYYQNQ
jgi:hypothetical protein